MADGDREAARKARLAERLRANLGRRKERARARGAGRTPEGGGTTIPSEEGGTVEPEPGKD